MAAICLSPSSILWGGGSRARGVVHCHQRDYFSELGESGIPFRLIFLGRMKSVDAGIYTRVL